MLSVIIPYHNAKKNFLKTLESIKKQNFPGDFEVIAVDEGSSSSERIEDLKNDFPFLKVIRIEAKDKWFQNSGISFNLGIQKAKGEKIIIQKAEALHFGEILESTKNHLHSGTFLQFSAFYDCINDVADENEVHQKASPQISGWLQNPVYNNSQSIFCTAFLREDLEKLGGFDELFSLGKGYDELELLWRVEKMGLNKICPENCFVKFSSYPIQEIQDEKRNMLLFAEHTKRK